jgi:hypothetical protein
MRTNLFLGGVVLSLAAAIAYSQPPENPFGKGPKGLPGKAAKKGGASGMQQTAVRHPQWEYTVRSVDEMTKLGEGDLTAGLNKFGEEGWELVLANLAQGFGTPMGLCFKRAKAPPFGVGAVRAGIGFGGGKGGVAAEPPPVAVPQFHVVRLSYTPADHAARLLHQCFVDRNGVETGPRIVADERTGNLLLAGNEEQLVAARRLIDLIDVPTPVEQPLPEKKRKERDKKPRPNEGGPDSAPS